MTLRSLCSIVILTGVVMTSACTSDIRNDPSGSVADSAGIEIITSHEPRWKTGEEWNVTPDPVLTIGGATVNTPDHIFSFITSVFRLSTGSIFVVDESDPRVRIFDSAGKLLRSTGRVGDGPGEFRNIWRAFRLRGDTVVITGYDRNVVWLTGTGDYVRAVSPLDVASTSFAMLLDGRMVAVPLKESPGFSRITSAEAKEYSKVKAFFSRLHLADRDGKSIADLGMMEYSKRTGGAFELLYGAKQYQAARERYYTGYAEEYSINVRDRNGKLIRIMRRDVPPVPISAAETEVAREVRRKNAPKGTIAEREIPFLEPAKHHPFFSEIMVDAAEYLWVREYRKQEDGIYRSKPQPREGGEPQRFDIFDPDGFWLGTVQLPNQFQVTDIGTDYIAGIWRDEDLVESVRVYGLGRIAVRR